MRAPALAGVEEVGELGDQAHGLKRRGEVLLCLRGESRGYNCAMRILVAAILLLAGCLLCSTTYVYPEVCRAVLSDSWNCIVDDKIAEEKRNELQEKTLSASIAMIALQLWASDPWAQEYSYNDEGEYGNPSSVRYPEVLDFISNRTFIDGYSHELDRFYANPYTAAAMDYYNARLVPYGWTQEAVGNFSYLKQYADDGGVCGFVLVGWGPDPDGGLDLDGDGDADGALVMMASWHILNMDGEFIKSYSLDRPTEMIPVSDGGRDFVLIWHGELYPWETAEIVDGE